MSDQGLSEETRPDVAGPDGTGEAEQAAQAEIDWQKRYGDLQPEYTRVTQENADLRRQQELYDLLVSTDDANTRREIAQRLGYVLDEEEAQVDDELEDPFAHYEQRLGRLEQTITQRDEEQANAAYAAQVRTYCDEQLEQLGLDRDDQEWVLAYAINALPVNAEGMPDVAQAHGVFVERENARQRKWAQSKKAPAFTPHGQAATEVPNLDKRQDRVDYMTRRYMENQEA